MVKRINSLAFEDYPSKRGRYQTGYGPVKFNVFRAYTPINRQRGHGFGGLMRGLFRRAVPLLKKGLAHAGRRALRAGGDVLEDILVNKTPLKQAVKKRARSEANELANVFKNKVVGRGLTKNRNKKIKTSKNSINRAVTAFPFINTPTPKRRGRKEKNLITL